MRYNYFLRDLNHMSQADFVAAIGHVFEHSAWIAAAAWMQRPFADRAALHQAMVRVVASAPVEQQLGLICAHPDLAGRIMVAGELTPESSAEQAAAGLTMLNAAEMERFTAYNTAYRARFGFPFVICAREHKKDAILAAFPRRLANNREQEIAAALAEIAKIAWFRVCDLIADETP
ncbi:MAG: 2-oxo-4-hydroxy-4-carboxy-5-ureidoimidazoline decarboxylase [Oscillochloris sp.]|nr:2-oxo-4-hydroxy-4-carboxy-5-ureidoimidazoline decarboxylase [Oscillochloris sp.]